MPGTTTPSASTAQSQSLTTHLLTAPPRAGATAEELFAAAFNSRATRAAPHTSRACWLR